MSDFFREIITVIFGDYSLIQLFGFCWFFGIGFILNGLNETDSRDKKSQNTPQKWSWKFWYNDNWKRYLATILSTYILFVFYTELVGHEFTNYEALMLGIIGDGIGAIGKRRINVVKGNREKIMAKMPDEKKMRRDNEL